MRNISKGTDLAKHVLIQWQNKPKDETTLEDLQFVRTISLVQP